MQVVMIAVVVLLGLLCIAISVVAARNDKEIQTYYMNSSNMSNLGKQAVARCRAREEQRIKRELGME